MYRKRPGSLIKHIDFLILDLLCLLASLLLGFYFRQNNMRLWGQEAYRSAFLLIAMMHILIAVFGSAYRGVLRRGPLEELVAVFKHIGLVLSFTVILLFFIKASDILSRLVIVYTWLLSFLTVYAERLLWKQILKRHMKSTSRQLLLVAGRENAERVLKKLKKRMLDFEVCGVVLLGEEDVGEQAAWNDAAASPAASTQYILDVPIVAKAEELPAYLAANVVDEVLLSISEREALPKALLHDCALMGLTVHIEYAVLDDLPGARYHEQIAGIDVLTSYTNDVSAVEEGLKRLMDITGGLLGVLLTGILCIFLAPMIYLADPGPILFRQKRVGRNGRIFAIYKFRSMYRDAEQRKAELMAKNEMKGLMFKLEADPRIIGSGPDGTRHGLGHFLRSSSLDEFPQFWNVLRGDMSLVGTRPPTLEEYEQYDIHHRARLAIKPGITGLWQISGRSDIRDFEDVVRLDTEYIRNWSLWLDVKILLKTVWVVVMRKGSR